MDIKAAKQFIEEFTKWARMQEEILGVLLVGSFARHAAKPDSDIDLVIITSKPETYLDNNGWVESFGKVKEIINEDYKMVQVKRVFFENGLEVEFGITTKEWVKVDPLDKGTKGVIKDGARILLDKERLLENLLKNI